MRFLCTILNLARNMASGCGKGVAWNFVVPANAGITKARNHEDQAARWTVLFRDIALS